MISATKSWPLAVASAIGGAALLFVGAVAVEEYKLYRHKVDQENIDEIESREQKKNAAENLIERLDAHKAVAYRAGKYIETGYGGSSDDINEVASHFRIVIRSAVNDKTDNSSVRSLYGGKLDYWSTHFQMISAGTSPVASRFSKRERAEFGKLSKALRDMQRGSDEQAKNSLKAVVNSPDAAAAADGPGA